MFSRPLPALLVLVGVALAAVQVRVQDSEIFAENQVPLRHAKVDFPFDTDSLESKFEPVRELSALGSDQWTTLRHPVFPRYSVRIKQSRFCDSTVK